MKKFITLIFFVMVFVIQTAFVYAKSTEKVPIIWSNDVLTMSNSSNSILNYKN